jgi:hypothetical protein
MELKTFAERLSSLYSSYDKHIKIPIEELPFDVKSSFEKIAEAPFKGAFVEFDTELNTLDVDLWFDEHILVCINFDLDGDWDGVLFSIFHEKKTLAHDEMELNELVDKLIEVYKEKK